MKESSKKTKKKLNVRLRQKHTSDFSTLKLKFGIIKGSKQSINNPLQQFQIHIFWNAQILFNVGYISAQKINVQKRA